VLFQPVQREVCFASTWESGQTSNKAEWMDHWKEKVCNMMMAANGNELVPALEKRSSFFMDVFLN